MRTITILILSASALLSQTPNLTPEQARERTATRAQELNAVWAEEKALEKKLAELRIRYSESYPEVVSTKAQLERLRAKDQELSSESWVRAAAATLTETAQRARDAQQQAAIAQAAANTASIERARAVEQIMRRADLAQQLAKLKAREAEIEARISQLRDQHPDIPALKQQLEALRNQERGLAASNTPGVYYTSLSQEDAANLPVFPLNPDAGRAPQQPLSAISPSPLDRWWWNNATSRSLGLSSDQQKRMDEVLQQYRLKLVDVNGALQKEEIALEPLVGADKLDETRITAQIDRVAQARAELEKVNGRMLLQIRKQLTSEQWRKLNQSSAGFPK